MIALNETNADQRNNLSDENWPECNIEPHYLQAPQSTWPHTDDVHLALIA
jgi:hypothetical protein